MTVCIAVAALWILARLRFPERPVTVNPIPPLLTQLAPRATLEDLASEVAQLQPFVVPLLHALDVQSLRSATDTVLGPPVVPALRIRPDVVVTLLDGTGSALGAPRVATPPVIASDPASGLAVVRVSAEPAPALAFWSPERVESPRYLIASEVSGGAVSLRPVFVGALHPIGSPVFPEPIWAGAAHGDLVPGAFVFTIDAALVGLVVEHEGQPAIVPAAVLMGVAERLLQNQNGEEKHAGELGVEVQGWPPATAAGLREGVIVSWVDPQGPAAGKLAVFDVIERADGEAVLTPQYWLARMARLAAGDAVTVLVRRGGDLQEVQIMARASAPPARDGTLGLTMRAVRGVGVEVVRVDRASVAGRAGIEAGDVMTAMGDVQVPTPAQVTRAFDAAPPGRTVLVAITRGDAHRVVALEKP